MKSFFLVAAFAAVAAVNAAECDLTVLSPIVRGEDANQCTADSTYSFLPPSAPTADILPKLCASAACQKTLAAVKALNLGACTVSLTTPPIVLDAFVSGFEKACAGATGASTSTGSGSSAGSKGAASATIETPAPTKAAASTASSSAGSKTSATVPSPSPSKSAASAVTVASGAVVLAAAAAFL